MSELTDQEIDDKYSYLWTHHPKPSDPTYSSLISEIDKGNIVYIDHRYGPTCGKYFYTSTKEQLDQVIDARFEVAKEDHLRWDKKMEDGSVFCDGLVYAISRGLLDLAISSPSPENRYNYLFQFSHYGMSFSVLPRSSVEEGRISKYPIWDTYLKQLS